MKSISTALFVGLMAVSALSNAAGKANLKKEDHNLKSIRPVACAMRASMNLSDCTDSSCQKAVGVKNKAAGTDGSVKTGG